ncbi:hypothetical protein [Natronorubrum sp. DTA7]|uniref:hypothetical protein n=1 Tax=Natronorubrum sp. DTA7 TaxID=3447016 RepID=UPI003F841855
MAPEIVLEAIKRQHPGGVVFSKRTGPRIRLDDGVERQISFEFDDPLSGPIVGRWLYEIRCQPADRDRSDSRYLCESDPIRQRPTASTEPEPDDIPPDWDHYTRRDHEGRYDVSFDWVDSTNTRWKLEHSISKSAYQRALRRKRGYIRTFLESQMNPYSRHLIDSIEASAVRVDENAREDPQLTERDRLERVVGFVQSLEYSEDRDSKDAREYHRTVEESIVDGTGDCKDGTYLLGGLLSQPPFEYETALILMPDHLLLGVHRAALPSGYRGLETVDDSPYVAVETTSRHRIGRYRDDPIVAVIGDSYQTVDPQSTGTTVNTQIRLHAAQYGL